MNFPMVFNEAKTLQFLSAKAAPSNMPAFRLLNIHKTVQCLPFIPKSKPIIIRQNFRSYSRSPEEFYSNVEVTLSLSVTTRVRTKVEHYGGVEFDHGVEKVEIPPRMEVGSGTSRVRTKQEVEIPPRMEMGGGKSRVHTKQEHCSGEEFGYDVENVEIPPRMEMRGGTSRVRTKQEHYGEEFDYDVENVEIPPRMEMGGGTSRVRTKQENYGGEEYDYCVEEAEIMEVGFGDDREKSGTRKGKGRSDDAIGEPIEGPTDVGESSGCTDEEQSGRTDEEGSGEIGTMRRKVEKSWLPNDRKVGKSLLPTGRKVGKAWLPKAEKSMKLTDVCGRFDVLNKRIRLPGLVGGEVERVLGGGIVPGTLVLVGGDPGVGKSTLLLQIASLIAEGDGTDAPAQVLYVSGEESPEQIGSRADRLCIKKEGVLLNSSTDIEEVIEQAQYHSPRVIIIDSIQTTYLRGVTGSTGGPRQVKECTFALLRYAKETNIPIILIGHVTKTGCVAGPRTLEHAVDVVLYVEGEKSLSHRLLRPVKNRFGSTDEVGVFKMSESGLQGLSNPSKIFLVEQHFDSEFRVGCAVAVILEGTRAFLIQIQASCGSKKNVNGAKASRVDMIISAIKKQTGRDLEEAIFVNVVNGVCLKEGGGDLAIAAAICSSLMEVPVPEGTAFIAEVGLGGELRVVPELEKRINTVAQLGYKKCVVPYSREKSFSELQLEGMQVLACKNLKEMIKNVFGHLLKSI